MAGEGGRIIYGIPSFRRVQCKTAEMLLNYGIEPGDIVISVQTEQDYEEYRAIWGRRGVNILFREADCAAGNRNTILDKYKKVLLLDDDITSFAQDTGKSFTNIRGGFDDIIADMFKIAEDNGAELFGVAPTDDRRLAVRRGRYSIDVLLQGTVMGVKAMRFNEKYKMVEDYEISLRAIQSGKRIFRFNAITARKPQNGTNSGGYHEKYVSGEQKEWIKKLEREFSIFKANKDFKGGRLICQR